MYRQETLRFPKIMNSCYCAILHEYLYITSFKASNGIKRKEIYNDADKSRNSSTSLKNIRRNILSIHVNDNETVIITILSIWIIRCQAKMFALNVVHCSKENKNQHFAVSLKFNVYLLHYFK